MINGKVMGLQTSTFFKDLLADFGPKLKFWKMKQVNKNNYQER